MLLEVRIVVTWEGGQWPEEHKGDPWNDGIFCFLIWVLITWMEVQFIKIHWLHIYMCNFEYVYYTSVNTFLSKNLRDL